MKSTQVSHEPIGDPLGNHSLGSKLNSASGSSNDGRKVSRQDIELVQNLIERCLQLYMNRDEVVKILLTRARIDPGFTTLVWQKLEEENADFFRAYYIRLKLKKQILLFNHLLEHQYNLMKYPISPANNMPVGYPLMQLPPIPGPAHPYSVVNGVPSAGGYQPIRVEEDAALAIPPAREMTPVSPASVESGGEFPFTASEISWSPLDHIPWEAVSDLSADLSNIGDLGPLGMYPGSPFLHSDSEILLDSPDHENIDYLFVENILGEASPSDAEKGSP